jgi:predicted aspartyl protease
MGEIYSFVTITSFADPSKTMKFQALIDTGASYLTLPNTWKDQLGKLDLIEAIEVRTATQEKVPGEVCGPVKIQIEGFRPIASEVLFIDMEPDDGNYEPLLGHLALQQAGVAIDLLSHRLMKGRYLLK